MKLIALVIFSFCSTVIFAQTDSSIIKKNERYDNYQKRNKNMPSAKEIENFVKQKYPPQQPPCTGDSIFAKPKNVDSTKKQTKIQRKLK